MPEFFLELFSEEIPARMQAAAVDELLIVMSELFRALKVENNNIETYYGPRRIAVRADVAHEKPGGTIEARGPRDTAPDAALAGFLSKNQAKREDLVTEGGYFWLRRKEAAVPAARLLSEGLPGALVKFRWPKSMRWGQSGDFAWVRPLRRVVCLLNGEVVPIQLGPVVAGNETEGHRVHAPGAFAVSSAKDWEEKLRARHVLVSEGQRSSRIIEGIKKQASALDLSVLDDPALLQEVTGLVEWPVVLIGRIDSHFMDLPPEVRELSMKINQKYFALRDANGNPAPYFAFVANLEAMDGGTAIIAGNERVLRARLSDAGHFWLLDLKTPLNDLLPKLEKVTFHAKIGTQRERAGRISELAGQIAASLSANDAECNAAREAGLLCKADLVSGMVGEFPELQGVMGGYYAGDTIGPAIKTHYQPKGPTDVVPVGIVAISVALADKLDMLAQFFAIGEKPTGSGDPYALRRAALGVIRIVLENELIFPLNKITDDAGVLDFIGERLRVKLRTEGDRFDVLDAVLAVKRNSDLLRIINRVKAISDFLETEDGINLLVGYRRAANILRIEDAKDGPHLPGHSSNLLLTPEEIALQAALKGQSQETLAEFNSGVFRPMIIWLATLRPIVDAFFDKVTVNVPEPHLRRARLGLLAQLVDRMHMIADFSKIEG